MKKFKVAMLGAYAVGKTSLVQRFVTGIFSDRYQTTVGVRIDKRQLAVDGAITMLLLWDLQGEDDLHEVPMHHLRGANGFLLVADGTRGATLDTALRLRGEAERITGPVPSMLLLNKGDLRATWEVTDDRLTALAGEDLPVITTSARTGDGVEGAFGTLARRMHQG
jgi:small GTP-binding protein